MSPLKVQFRLVLIIFLSALLGCEHSSLPRPQQAKPAVQEDTSASDRSAKTILPRAGAIYAGSIAEGGRMTHYVRPEYPQWARKQHMEGIVKFRGIVGRDGIIHDLTFLKGPKELAPYAEAAVRQWRYSPLSLQGTQVDFVTRPLVSFNLHQ